MPGYVDEDDACGVTPSILALAGRGSNADTGRFLPSAERARSATIRGPPVTCTPMDLDVQPRRRTVPRRVPRLARGPRAPRRRCPSGDTREGFAAHLAWERTLFDARYAVVSWPEEYGGRDASLWEWLIFEEEYYRAGAPQRVTQNGIFLLAPTIFEFGTPEQQDRILAEDGVGRTDVVPGLVGTERGQRPRRHPVEGGARRRGRRLAALRARRRGRRAARSARTSSDSSAATPKPNGTAASRTSSSTSSTPGVTVRPVERLDGDEGFAEVFFDDVFVPDADVLGEPHQGWQVAMATTGSERGLTLRSPGRFLATAQRLIDLYHERSDDPALRDRLVDAVDRRRGLPVADVLDRHPHRRGRIGRRGVEPGEAVLVRARRAPPRARARTARRRTPNSSTATTRRG